MKQNPLVSVIIPSYKRCDTVVRAIDSVLAQTYTEIEVLLVDDNIPNDKYSTELKEVLKQYETEKRVRYIAQKMHVNGAVARNLGVKSAHGAYIAFLDDDDEWLPEKIEKQMELLKQNPTVDAVTVLWKNCKENIETRRCTPYSADDLQFKVFLREVAIFTSTVLIKKEVIEQFGGFDETLLRHQDLQFLITALEVAKFEVIPEYLVVLHEDSTMNRPNTKKLICIKKAFFESVKEIYDRYSRENQKRIQNAHCYEIAFCAMKEKKYFIAVYYIIRCGINVNSIQDLMKRSKERQYRENCYK